MSSKINLGMIFSLSLKITKWIKPSAFAHFKMSDLSLVDSIWRMLDELAVSDPGGYQKFVSEQLKLKPSLLSKPRCRGFQKCTSRVFALT